MATSTKEIEELVAAARAVMDCAYAPYSGFHVGAAVLGADGSIHAGCNVENVAFPQGTCAEAGAIAAMVAAGSRQLTAVAVMAGGSELIVPCGGCRQKLAEFGGPDVAVHLCDPSGVRRTLTLGELLPHGFGPGHLAGAGEP